MPHLLLQLLEGDTANTNPDNSDSYDYWWWILSFLLVFVLFAIFGVRRELSAAIAAKEEEKLIPQEHL